APSALTARSKHLHWVSRHVGGAAAAWKGGRAILRAVCLTLGYSIVAVRGRDPPGRALAEPGRERGVPAELLEIVGGIRIPERTPNVDPVELDVGRGEVQHPRTSLLRLRAFVRIRHDCAKTLIHRDEAEIEVARSLLLFGHDEAVVREAKRMRDLVRGAELAERALPVAQRESQVGAHRQVEPAHAAAFVRLFLDQHMDDVGAESVAYGVDRAE